MTEISITQSADVASATMKPHALESVIRHYNGGGALIRRYGKPDKVLSEAQARRIDKLLRDDAAFDGMPSLSGRTFYPLSCAERRRKIAQRKRNAKRRANVAAGLVERHGWSGHWQRR